MNICCYFNTSKTFSSPPKDLSYSFLVNCLPNKLLFFIFITMILVLFLFWLLYKWELFFFNYIWVLPLSIIFLKFMHVVAFLIHFLFCWTVLHLLCKPHFFYPSFFKNFKKLIITSSFNYLILFLIKWHYVFYHFILGK